MQNMEMTAIITVLAIYLAVLVNVISTHSSTTKPRDVPCRTQYFEASNSFFHCYHPDHEPTEDLSLDEAYVVISAPNVEASLTVFAQTDVCHECPCINITELHFGQNVTCKFDTAFAIQFVISEANMTNGTFCSPHAQLKEYGKYSLIVDKADESCHIMTIESPHNPYIPIYVAMAVFAVLAVLFVVFSRLYWKGYLYRVAICMPYERMINSDLGLPAEVMPQEQGSSVADSGESNATPRPPPKQRLKSLDTFRGLSLVVMIFVNYKGGEYWFFHHSAWNGLTVADLVFPWFVFIMGTSIALAFKSQIQRGTSKRQLLWKVIKRTVILFTFGLMISNSSAKGGGLVELKYLRIPGVLQRLALTYFGVATMQVFFAGRGQSLLASEARYKRVLQDVWLYWPEWIISLSLLALHICLTFLLQVPGCGRGYIGPGGLHEYPAHEHCTGGAAGYIDRVIFGETHIYHHPTCTVPYQTEVPYDPEGLLGTLTSIFMCFLGLQAGKIIIHHPGNVHRIYRWLIWCIITGAIAAGLCGFSQEGGVIPVNKNLWSVSFILALSSMAFLLLAVCYVLVDVLKIWSGAPFIFPGMNSIVIYMCHEVLHTYFPVQFAVPQTHAAQLAMHLYGAALWTAVAAAMYYKKVFIAI